MNREEYVEKYLEEYQNMQTDSDFRDFASKLIIDLSLEVKRFATHRDKQVFIDRLLKTNQKGNKITEDLTEKTGQQWFTKDFFLTFWYNKLGVGAK